MAKAVKKPAPKPVAKTVTKPTPKPAARAVTTTKPAGPPASIDALNQMPAFMRQDVDAGKQNIGQEDLEIPRLKLIQGVSPELQEYDELKAGHFFHPSAEHIFDGPFRAVPIYMDKRYILWNPLEAGGGILARADDGINWSPSTGVFNVKLDKAQGGANVTWKLAPTVADSGLANWGTQNPADPNSPPAATLMYNFLLAFPDEPDLMPAVLSFQRSSVKSGRRFLTKLRTQRTPLFGTVWEFGASHEQKMGRDYYTISVKGAGLVEDENLYLGYKAMAQAFGIKGLNIKDIEGLQSEDDSPVGDDADDGKPSY
jgi:hypothetical protein